MTLATYVGRLGGFLRVCGGCVKWGESKRANPKHQFDQNTEVVPYTLTVGYPKNVCILLAKEHFCLFWHAHIRAVDALIHCEPADRLRPVTYERALETTVTLPAASFQLSDASLGCLGAEPPVGSIEKTVYPEKGEYGWFCRMEGSAPDVGNFSVTSTKTQTRSG